ncbi:hypothetical protein OC846_003063 [Tilletia horrida]|uniref:Uncharacterized protein n=1 Tax=Tilletia horrida TaxID=155126 RepID=A0AAN6GQN2_9BASI|nr:hypothetical protein OC845_002823 [Tilletia horrida]KAK0551979.1 hypothetical protein OC846_003063 [Tilletia horrida]KAK0566176.1 hypothetical protein OC861_003397 [Tilletia horrida]
MSASPGPRTPKAGASSGRKVSVPFSHASSPSALRTGISSPASSANVKASLLSRNEETTYHRRLRSLLQDHAKARNAWLQLVSFDGIKAARALSLAWEDVDNARATPTAPKGKGKQTQPDVGALYARDKATASAVRQAEGAREDLEAIFAKINAQANRLTSLYDQAKALLLETAKAKGFEFVADAPLWGTWTMDRFVDALSSTTTQYVLCTAHLSQLVKRLSFYARDPLQPDTQARGGKAPAAGVPISASSLFGSGLDEDSRPDSERRNDVLEPERKRCIKLHNECMQAWARLPHLDEEPGQFLEEICGVEVGRWTER